MPIVRQIQTNFSGGEVDPGLAARVDAKAYQNGAKALRNFRLLNAGGAKLRPGTWRADTLPGKSRVIPFAFDTDETYVVVLVEGGAEIYQVVAGVPGSVQSLTGLPWAEIELWDITYTQTADVMILCHPSWSPQVLRRTGLTTFVCADLAFETTAGRSARPTYKFADDSVWLQPAAATGSTTLTAATSFFTTTMIGLTFRLLNAEFLITAFTSDTIVTGTWQQDPLYAMEPDPIRTTAGSAIVRVTHPGHGLGVGDAVTLGGVSDTGGIVAANLNGARTVVNVLDAFTYTVTAAAAAVTSTDGGGPSGFFNVTGQKILDWGEPAFSDLRGWPRACVFHDQRLWFASTPTKPDGLWGSGIGRFFDFAIGDGLPIDSVQVSVASDQIAEIRHLVSAGTLQLFTALGEYIVAAPQGQGITPATITIQRQTRYGSGVVRPQDLDGATLFATRAGSSVRELLFDDTKQKYQANAVSFAAAHLIADPIDCAVLYGNADRPEQYALFVNTDGSLAVFTSSRSENFAGWTLWETAGGLYRSACVVDSLMFVTVQRGETWVLEYFEDEDWLTLDEAVIQVAPPDTVTAAWTLPAAYWNRTVDVVANTAAEAFQWALGAYPVGPAGELTLDVEVASITAGRAVVPLLETLPPVVQLANGLAVDAVMRIVTASVILRSTLGLTVEGHVLSLRRSEDLLEAPSAPTTGTHRFKLLGYRRSPTLTLTQDRPEPLEVLGIVTEVHV